MPAAAFVRDAQNAPPQTQAASITIDPAKETLIQWDAWRLAQQGQYTVEWNTRTGYAGAITARGATARSGDPRTLAADMLRDLTRVIGTAPEALVLDDVTLAGNAYHLTYHQVANGVRVHDAEVRVHLTSGGQFLALTSSVAPGIPGTLSTSPAIDAYAAAARVLDDLRVVGGTPSVQLAIVPGYDVPGDQPLQYRLAWIVDARIDAPQPGDWRYIVDAQTGTLLTRVNRARYTSGTVQGNVFPNVGSDALSTRAFGWENVTVGATTVQTDATGFYTTTATGTITSSLVGPYVNVQNEDAAEVTFSSSGGAADYTVAGSTYSWVSATTASGIISDDQAKAFTLPFTFTFYGTAYTSVNVCSNGFLNFGTSSTSYTPAAIPNTGAPNALIAGFWRDLAPNLGGTIYYSSSASQFVVLWSAVRNYANTNAQTFEVILRPDGTITYQYQTVTNDVTTTRGVENQAGTSGKTNASPANVTAVTYTPTTGGGSSSWTWAYGTSDTHVDEVNGFYHVGLIHDYFKSVQGFTGMDYQILATVHYGTNYANAFYSPSDKNIYFGDGDGVNVLDTSKSRDVWYHEYTHGVVDHIYAIGQSGEAGAMSEGMADYFACTYTGDHLLGEWVFPDPRYQRDLLNTLKTPQDLTGEIHDDGRIYSGSVWDLRTSVGATVADKLAFQSFFYAPQSFSSGKSAFLSADAAVYGSTHTSAINTAFANHGIGSTGTSYTAAATTYSWVTTSTASGITSDDQSKAFTLPFTFAFYGANQTTVNVCSNGFFNFGTASTSYTPAAIPNTGAPNSLIAGFWRDLAPNLGGTITYSSSASQFVVTWSAVRNYANANTQTFQVILKPDGTITYQYQAVTNDVTTTIGVENSTGTAGTPWSAPGNGTAVKFTPSAGAPVVAGAPSIVPLGGASAGFQTALLGASGSSLRYTLSTPGRTLLQVFDPSGRMVRTVVDAEQPAGEREIAWDGRTSLTPGMYFARLAHGSEVRVQRFVMMR